MEWRCGFFLVCMFLSKRVWGVYETRTEFNTNAKTIGKDASIPSDSSDEYAGIRRVPKRKELENPLIELEENSSDSEEKMIFKRNWSGLPNRMNKTAFIIRMNKMSKEKNGNF